MSDSRPGTIRVIALLLALSYFSLHLLHLGVPEFGGSSEAREAHVMQSMVARGQWVFPERNGILPSKPPLHHWIGAAVGLARGKVDEMVARFPSLLAGALLLFAVAIRGAAVARLMNPRAERLPQYAALSSFLVLATTYQFAALLSDARVDLTFSLWAALSAFSLLRVFERGVELPQRFSQLVTGRDWLMFYLCAGMAVLAKGPLGLLLPVLVNFCAGAYWSGVKDAFLAFARPRLGWLVFLALAVPWYVGAALSWSDAFVDRQIIFENLKRFTGGDQVNAEAWWYYVPSFLRSAFPWSILVLFVAAKDLRESPDAGLVIEGREPRAVRLRLTYLVACVAGFCFFSLAAGKRHSYLAPLLPIFAAYVGSALPGLIERVRHRWPARAALVSARTVALGCGFAGIIIGGSLLFLTSNMPLVSQRFPDAQAVSGLVEVYGPLVAAAFGAVSLLAASAVLVPRQPLTRALFATLSAASLMAVIILSAETVKNHLKGFRSLAYQLRQEVSITDEIWVARAVGDELFDPLLFYLERRVVLRSPDEVARECDRRQQSGKPLVIVGRMSWFEESYFARRPRRVLRFTQPADRITPRSDRDLMVAWCGTPSQRMDI